MNRRIEQDTDILRDSIKRLNKSWTSQIEHENSMVSLSKSLRRSTKDDFFPGNQCDDRVGRGLDLPDQLSIEHKIRAIQSCQMNHDLPLPICGARVRHASRVYAQGTARRSPGTHI